MRSVTSCWNKSSDSDWVVVTQHIFSFLPGPKPCTARASCPVTTCEWDHGIVPWCRPNFWVDSEISAWNNWCESCAFEPEWLYVSTRILQKQGECKVTRFTQALQGNLKEKFSVSFGSIRLFVDIKYRYWKLKAVPYHFSFVWIYWYPTLTHSQLMKLPLLIVLKIKSKINA